MDETTDFKPFCNSRWLLTSQNRAHTYIFFSHAAIIEPLPAIVTRAPGVAPIAKMKIKKNNVVSRPACLSIKCVAMTSTPSGVRLGQVAQLRKLQVNPLRAQSVPQLTAVKRKKKTMLFGWLRLVVSLLWPWVFWLAFCTFAIEKTNSFVKCGKHFVLIHIVSIWPCLQVLWLCNWLKCIGPLSQPIRGKTKTNRDLLARSHIPVLRAGYVYFLQALIGSLDCLTLLWLAKVISLVLALKTSLLILTIRQLTRRSYLLVEKWDMMHSSSTLTLVDTRWSSG